MKQLWKESRGNAIGGLIVAAILTLISWVGTVYADVGSKPFVIGVLVILWGTYFGYVIYWVLWQRRRRKATSVISDNASIQTDQSDKILLDTKETNQYYPCFISYSHRDEIFARQLYAELQQHEVQCWFAPEDMKIGDKIRQKIDWSIRSHERLLLILSENSINSVWVEKEIETAFEEEIKRKQIMLFPIRLDSAVIETDQAWAADIRRTRHIGDFTQWKNQDAYRGAFRRLLRDLEIDDTKGELLETGRQEKLSYAVTSKIDQHSRIDWADAPDVPVFYGRTEELVMLENWIIKEHCRLVTILGMRGIGKTKLSVKLGKGGIGKTDLSLKLARGIQDEFEYVIWRGLLNAPSITDFLADSVKFLSNQQEINLPDTMEGQISRLLHYLQAHRCLLILDNFEAILRGGEYIGQYQEGYEGYGELLRQVGDIPHQSCLLLTSREKPQEIARLEGKTRPTRSLELSGLDELDGCYGPEYLAIKRRTGWK